MFKTRIQGLIKALLWLTMHPLAWRRTDFKRVHNVLPGLHKSARLYCRGRIRGQGTLNIGRRCLIQISEGVSLELGNKVWISDDCEISPSGQSKIGENTSIQVRSILLGEFAIGRNCVIAPNLYLSSGRHRFRDFPPLPIKLQDAMAAQRRSESKVDVVEVHEDCWIGINVVITPGRVIGKGCVVGANSVVTHNLPPYSIAAGAPARVIGKRLEYAPPQQIDALEIDHLPYLYSGFRIPVDPQEFESSLKLNKGWEVDHEFSVALALINNRALRIQLLVSDSIVLRHGNHCVTVGPENTTADFPEDQLTYSPHQTLRFSWQTVLVQSGKTPKVMIRSIKQVTP